MMSFELPTGAAVSRGGRALLQILLIAAGIAFAMPCHHRASAGEPAKAASDAEVEPSFDLPPIIVQVSQNGRAHQKTMVFKAALVFDETDRERINDSMRMAKTLLPKIMDSVITGVQGHHFDAESKPEDVNKLILDRSVAVLQPYGVVVKYLRMESLGRH
ncbi:MAG: hypothetical protein GEU87_09715 [Alphaproteobacteria bacterium]|nr:hypothetical protein [Alphaproteobacteria bacterium]